MPRLSALAFSMGTFGLVRGGARVFDTVIFLSSESFVIPTGVTKIEYLIVAGGGGGSLGQDEKASGAGGGAGGFRTGSAFPVTPEATYSISIGGGGNGRRASPLLVNETAGSGSFIQGGSPETHLGANGGGFGGRRFSPLNYGGSGGGGYDSTPFSDPAEAGESLTLTNANGHNQTFVTTPSQGSDGGTGFWSAGGGGGAGGAGSDGTPTSPLSKGASGGIGLVSEFSGVSTYYAGGGGGCGGGYGKNSDPTVLNPFGEGGNGGLGGGGNGFGPGSWYTPGISGATFNPATNGEDNTGGGGGGGAGGISQPQFPAVSPLPAGLESYRNALKAGSGGSGIVIIKFEQTDVENFTFVRSFTGSTTWTAPTDVTEIDFLIVAGGGAGNKYSGTPGPSVIGVGGSGGGGVRIGTSLPVTPGVSYTIEVGAGGDGPSSPDGTPFVSVTSGSGSSIQGAFAAPISPIQHIGSNGGGVGGSFYYPSPGAPATAMSGTDGGCSGGGASSSPVDDTGAGSTLALNPTNGHSYPITGENVTRGAAVQGYDGAPGYNWSGTRLGGGGGGAGGDGVRGRPRGGNGGLALVTNITGISTGYGGGGGGSLNQGSGTSPLLYPPNSMLGGSTNDPLLKGGGMDGFGNTAYGSSNSSNKDAPANTGGGSAGVNGPSNGGSGIVIIKYTLPKGNDR